MFRILRLKRGKRHIEKCRIALEMQREEVTDKGLGRKRI